MLTVNVDKTFFRRSLIFNSPTRFLRTAYWIRLRSILKWKLIQFRSFESFKFITHNHYALADPVIDTLQIPSLTFSIVEINTFSKRVRVWYSRIHKPAPCDLAYTAAASKSSVDTPFFLNGFLINRQAIDQHCWSSTGWRIRGLNNAGYLLLGASAHQPIASELW